MIRVLRQCNQQSVTEPTHNHPPVVGFCGEKFIAIFFLHLNCCEKLEHIPNIKLCNTNLSKCVETVVLYQTKYFYSQFGTFELEQLNLQSENIIISVCNCKIIIIVVFCPCYVILGNNMINIISIINQGTKRGVKGGCECRIFLTLHHAKKCRYDSSSCCTNVPAPK